MLRAVMFLNVVAMLLAGCGVPEHGSVWLSYTRPGGGCEDLAHCPALTDEAETSRYYQAIGAEDADGNPVFNLEQWKQQFGIQNATVIRAVYGNKLDLLLGRDMNCWEPQGTNRVVCYVSNYGPAPYVDGEGENTAWPNLRKAVADAIEGDIHKSFATVGMVYDPNGIGVNGDKVAFYVFAKADDDGNQTLVRSAALDGEGPKTIPRMCMGCHGGRYYDGTHSIYDPANFLPFDVHSFYYSEVNYPSDFILDNQQEAFRQLNALVLKTQPRFSAIRDLVNGWYEGNVNTPGATVPTDTYIPDGWNVGKTSVNLYRFVYRKYCQMCHVAVLPFREFAQFTPELVADVVCGRVVGNGGHVMPNAQVPYGSFKADGRDFRGFGFWQESIAQSLFREYVKDATAPNGCN